MRNGIMIFSGASSGFMNTDTVEKPGWLTYTGDYVTWFQVFGEKLYAEYEFRTSGILAVTKKTLIDLYLVGGGGRGGSAATYTPSGGDTESVDGGGGGSGYPRAVLEASVLDAAIVTVGKGQQDTVVQIGATAYSAQKGGNGSALFDDQFGTVHGAGFQGTYYLYDDENWPVGTAQYTIHSRAGSNGCSVLSLVRGFTTGASNAMQYSGVGYGAGGGGGTFNLQSSAYWSAPADGAQGIVRARVLLSA